MVTIRYSGDALWARIEQAVEKVKARFRRVTQAFDAASIDYAVVGRNAVQVWVAQVDEPAVRNTRDVVILIRNADLQRTIDALRPIGFVFRRVAGVAMFVDGAQASARDAVHVVIAGEKVRPDYVLPAPDVSACELVADTRTLSLEALVRMKLTSFRRQDQVHLLDMLKVGLIDKSWVVRFPAALADRLQKLIDSPDG